MLSRINKVNSYPSDLKDVFTNVSGLSTGGSSSAQISSGGLGSLMMVGSPDDGQLWPFLEVAGKPTDNGGPQAVL